MAGRGLYDGWSWVNSRLEYDTPEGRAREDLRGLSIAVRHSDKSQTTIRPLFVAIVSTCFEESKEVGFLWHHVTVDGTCQLSDLRRDHQTKPRLLTQLCTKYTYSRLLPVSHTIMDDQSLYWFDAAFDCGRSWPSAACSPGHTLMEGFPPPGRPRTWAPRRPTMQCLQFLRCSSRGCGLEETDLDDQETKY